jgi:hypothetical protein
MCRFGLLLWWWAGWSSGGLVVAARVDDQVAEERPENARAAAAHGAWLAKQEIHLLSTGA